MAILKPTTKRLDVPNEPGEWVEIRRVSDYETPTMRELSGDRIARTDALVRFFIAAIVAWSYPEPVTFDAIAGVKNAHGVREGGMDRATAVWLQDQIFALSRGEKTDADRLPSTSPSNAS